MGNTIADSCTSSRPAATLQTLHLIKPCSTLCVMTYTNSIQKGIIFGPEVARPGMEPGSLAQESDPPRHLYLHSIYTLRKNSYIKQISKCIVAFIANVKLHFYRPRSERDNALGSVCQTHSVCPFVCALTAEPFDLRPSSFAWRSTLTLARLTM